MLTSYVGFLLQEKILNQVSFCQYLNCNHIEDMRESFYCCNGAIAVGAQRPGHSEARSEQMVGLQTGRAIRAHPLRRRQPIC